METPVTRAQWTALLGTDPSYFKRDPRLPVERINWFEAVALANALSKKEGLRAAAGPGVFGGRLGADPRMAQHRPVDCAVAREEQVGATIGRAT